MTLRVFGLTGGIGSGKSTVATLLRQRGVAVVDADALAREAVSPGSEGLAQVLAEFGNELLTAGGELDRKALGSLVFNDPAARKRLNDILHPRVRKLSQERFAELGRTGVTLAAYDVPLLFEVGIEQAFRPVVVVAVSEATQVARVMSRDGSLEADARARIAAQLPMSEKRSRADYVLDNDGDLLELEQQVDDLVGTLRRELVP